MSGPTPEALAAAKRIVHDVLFRVFAKVEPRDDLDEHAARIIDAAIAEACEPLQKAVSGCGGCDYSESDGGLFRHCDSCLEQIARTAWTLCTSRAAITPKEPDHARRND